MNDDQLRRAYQARRVHPDKRAEPTPEELQQLAAGEGPEAERLETLDRALASRSAERELELFRAVAHAARREARPWWRSPLPLGLAAALLLTAVGVIALQRPDGGEIRAPAADGAPVLVDPRDGGRVGADVRFVWRPVAGARAYRLELLTDAGIVVTSTETVDTVVNYRATAAPGPYRWLVVALRSEGIEVPSRPRLLTIAAP